jgi:VanZ family protein
VALAALAVGLFMPGRWATWLSRLAPLGPYDELLIHALLFACVAAALVFAQPWRVKGWHVVVLGLLVGAGTEALQSLVGREAVLGEVGADLLGACLGGGLALLAARRRGSDPAA